MRRHCRTIFAVACAIASVTAGLARAADARPDRIDIRYIPPSEPQLQPIADYVRQAQALEKAVDLRRVQMAYGLNQPIPSIAQGVAQQYGERERAVIAHEKARSIIGTPERVTEKLHALQEQFNADELIVLTVAGSYAARTRSYQLLADAFALGRSA